MAKGMSEFQAGDEVAVDGVTYIRLWRPPAACFGDPSGILDHFDGKECYEIRRRMMAHLVEAGYFIRKDDFEKKHIYKKDELFYGL
jgi:hypothetical protein